MAIDPLQLVFEAAYLHARRLFGMSLSLQEINRLGLLSAMLADEGRRRFLRLSVSCEGSLAHPSGKLPARVVDLSVEGCLVETSETVDKGAEVRLTLECGEYRRIFTGVVCRSSSGERSTIALRFTGIPLELHLTSTSPAILDAKGALS